MAAWHAQAVSEDALGDLRVILDETLDRIKTEVFAGREPGARRPADSAAGQRPGTGPGTSPPPEGETGPGTGRRPHRHQLTCARGQGPGI